MFRAIFRANMIVSALAGAMVAGFAGVVSAADSIITDVRIGDHGTKTRFVLDMSRSLDMRFFLLDAPYRIVMDFGELDWQVPPGSLPRPTGMFKAMRYGLYKPSQSRIVIETNRPAVVDSAFYLPPTENGLHRFVVDMVPVTRGTFLGALNATQPVFSSGAGYARDGGAPETQAVSAATGFMVPKIKPAYIAARKRVVAIDAGHGGADPGTVGKSGVYEKHITIAAARIIKRVMEASGRYTVVLTRDRDIFVPLRRRVETARKADAELFVSVHADSLKDTSVRGASVYTLSEKASDKEAALLAEKENKADVIGGIDLSGESQEVTNILIDLAQREAMNESARYAGMLVEDLKKTGSILSRAHRFAGFAVLKAPDMPSVLIELGFLSNTRDEKNLRSKAYLKKIAQALLRSTDHYFSRVQQATIN